jgi:hypothetical protein
MFLMLAMMSVVDLDEGERGKEQEPTVRAENTA